MWASNIHSDNSCNHPCSVLFLAETSFCFTWSNVTNERVVAQSFCGLYCLGTPILTSTVPDKAANFARAHISLISAELLLVDSRRGAGAILRVMFLTIFAREADKYVI